MVFKYVLPPRIGPQSGSRDIRNSTTTKIVFQRAVQHIFSQDLSVSV
jgi:hypothetical protein